MAAESFKEIMRSFVIPVLDFSPHSPYNVLTLLEDLKDIPGEVICIFNSQEVFAKLNDHPRIDKFCFNNLNAGVTRSWNLGINLAEGRAVFILNADLHISLKTVEEMEAYLFGLKNAVIVGPQGSFVDFKRLKVARYFEKGKFDRPVQTHDVSGFLFCIHLERFLGSSLMFDPRFSPCEYEEWDIGLQILKAGLACYAVPVDGFDHHWGVSSAGGEKVINYFGRDMVLKNIILENRQKLRQKWVGLIGNP